MVAFWGYVMRLLIAILLCFEASAALAHGGGLDVNGCHHDRKRGGYHCHGTEATAPVYSAPSPPTQPALKPSGPKATTSGAAATATVTADTLLVRQRPSRNAPVVLRLHQGDRVNVLATSVTWWQIDPDGSGVLPSGFVASQYLRSDASSQLPRKTVLTDAEVAQQIIAEGLARYPGNCGCPYQTDRAGHRCGARSAYVRRGGYALYCYPSDVPQAQIEQRR